MHFAVDDALMHELVVPLVLASLAYQLVGQHVGALGSQVTNDFAVFAKAAFRQSYDPGIALNVAIPAWGVSLEQVVIANALSEPRFHARTVPVSIANLRSELVLVLVQRTLVPHVAGAATQGTEFLAVAKVHAGFVAPFLAKGAEELGRGVSARASGLVAGAQAVAEHAGAEVRAFLVGDGHVVGVEGSTLLAFFFIILFFVVAIVSVVLVLVVVGGAMIA